MCYTREDWSREGEARRLRAEEQAHAPTREADIRSERHRQEEEKPPTETVKEVVGVR
jgi:hypothetical protein